MLRDDIINPYLDQHPWPLLFVTVSGAHLYGFESPDSDYDLRGVHCMPAASVIGLDVPRETYEVMDLDAEIEMAFEVLVRQCSIDRVAEMKRRLRSSLHIDSPGGILSAGKSPTVAALSPSPMEPPSSSRDDSRRSPASCGDRPHPLLPRLPLRSLGDGSFSDEARDMRRRKPPPPPLDFLAPPPPPGVDSSAASALLDALLPSESERSSGVST